MASMIQYFGFGANSDARMMAAILGIPTYKLKGKALVHFGGFEKHIGFYATPTGHTEFEEELSNYKQGKGSVQFPLDQPMPLDLIKRIVEFRIKEQS